MVALRIHRITLLSLIFGATAALAVPQPIQNGAIGMHTSLYARIHSTLTK